MFQLDVKSRKSIYEQVMDAFKERISSGEMKADEKLTSVRDLSRLLTINPNTVQKAYRELEREGYVYTVAGLGTFVASPENRPRDEEKIGELTQELRNVLVELRHQGLSPAEIASAAAEFLNERGVNK